MTTALKNEIVLEISAVDHNAILKVGAYDPDKKRIGFGMDAEIWVTTRGLMDDGGFVAQVSIGGIGSHDTTTGRLRARAYSEACSLAENINTLLERADPGPVLVDVIRQATAGWTPEYIVRSNLAAS